MRCSNALFAGSPGRSMLRDETPAIDDPVLIFDLDGTILSVNSFPTWILFLICGPVQGVGLRRRMRLSLSVQRLLLNRRLGRAAHEELLRGAQAACVSACCDAGSTERLEAALERRVRPSLRPILEHVARGADAVLATAAAAEYAIPLGSRLGFRHVLATPSGRSPLELSNKGTRKRDRVLRFVHEQGWSGRKLLFFTDHMDDLPLIVASDTTLWFGTPAMLHAVERQARASSIVDCRPLDATALTKLVRSLHGVSSQPGTPRARTAA